MTLTLPDKPSALIRLALADLVKCERSKKYRIDMEFWHMPNSQCAVCLAGAVIAKTLGADSGRYVGPSDFLNDTYRKLCALNAFRTGSCRAGFEYLRRSVIRGRSFYRDIVDYEDDPKEFKRDMRKLAADLEEAGY